MSTPKEPPTLPEKETAEEEEQVILLTNPIVAGAPVTLETSAVDKEEATASTAEIVATTPDLPGVQESDAREEEEVLLLTKPSGRMQLVDLGPTGPARHTVLHRSPSQEFSIVPTMDEVPQHHDLLPEEEIPVTPPPTQPGTITPHPSLDTTPPHARHDSPADLSAVLELDPYATVERDEAVVPPGLRGEESSETELMLDMLGGQALSRAGLAQQSDLLPPESEISLSQISAYLEEDDGDPIATFQKNDFRPSHEYLHPPEAAHNPNYKRTRQLQVLRVILAELTQHCARACCFLHKEGLLIGVAAMGKGKIQERIEDLLFPVDVPSLLSHSIQTQKSFQGMLHLTAMDQIMAACLGGALPQQVAVFPILQNNRAVAVFYMDDGGEGNFPQDSSALESIMERASGVDYRWSPPSLEELLSPLMPQEE